MAELVDRTGLAAADGSPVVGTQMYVSGLTNGLFATFAYTTTGTPATINVRAKIEVSVDGVTWHDVIRFIDQTTVGGAARIARLQLNATAAEGAAVQTALTTTAGAAVLSDGGLGDEFFIRAHTMLQALTGGSSPTVSIGVSVSARAQ